MDAATNNLPTNWEVLMLELDNRLDALQKEEPKVLIMASKAIHVCTEMLEVLQARQVDCVFSASEEIHFFKKVKPFFLAKLLYYRRLYELELRCLSVGVSNMEQTLVTMLQEISVIFIRNQFIYGYMKSGETYFDDKLFLPSPANSAIALLGVDFPPEAAYTIRFDHVVGHLLSAELLREYVESLLIKVRNKVFVPAGLPQITWTDSKTDLIELIYGLHAAGAFNHGKVDLKDIFEFIKATWGVDVGHFPRTFQEIVSRKKGYINAWNRYTNAFLRRVEKNEDNYRPAK